MSIKNITPESLRGSARATILVRYKGSEFILSKLQGTLFNILSDGKKHSSHNLMQLAHTSDPRKEVQYLRSKGINIQDEWVEAINGIPRHKLYFIDPKECGEEVKNECE